MKCPNCNSPMFVTNETANSRSQVTFYRCSVCVSEHVSSEPIMEASQDTGEYFESPSTERKRFLMV